jgi:hypothetical protein
MNDPVQHPPRYLGDGVYVSFDGWYVWLKTERDDGEHSIALELPVFKHLLEFCESVWRKR